MPEANLLFFLFWPQLRHRGRDENTVKAGNTAGTDGTPPQHEHCTYKDKRKKVKDLSYLFFLLKYGWFV
jgi:hypothetical protein